MLLRRLKNLKKPDPEAEQHLRDQIQEEGGLEKNDMKAMILAALITIMPVALVIFALFALMSLLFI